MYVQVEKREVKDMSEFTKDVASLTEYVGGKENIVSVTHCATRMRFALKDQSKADVKKIEALASVIGSFTQGGQFQVIIGNKVSIFYEEFIAYTHLSEATKEEVKAQAKNNMNLLQRALANLAEIFAPIIPAIICGGLILGFRNIIDSIKLFEEGTKTLVEISQFWNGVDSFLWLIGDAIFNFLPVGIVWSICKKMHVDQMLGIIVGITIVSPQLLSAGALMSTAAEDVPYWDFGFTTVRMVGYQSQVIPAILIGFAFVYIYRFFKKHAPDAISMIIVPFCSVVPTVLLAHVVLGPVGWAIGNFMCDVIMAGFNSSFGWLFGGIYGMLYPLLVITGMHHAMLPIDIQIAASGQGLFTFPIVALCNIAQATAVFAFAYIHKKNKAVQEIAVPAYISGYLGVTEPAMFGVNLKYFYPFVGAIIGSGITGLIAMSLGVLANGVGVGGLPAILSMQPTSMLYFGILMIVDVIVVFIVTCILSKTAFARKYEDENK